MQSHDGANAGTQPMGAVAHLTVSTDRNGRFSGYYKCSLCNAEFRPNFRDVGQLSRDFSAHVRLSHPAQGGYIQGPKAESPDGLRRKKRSTT